MIKFLEVIPLSIFLLVRRNINTEISKNWEVLFIASGLAAFIVIILFLSRKIQFNRLFLGINIYLISGGLAFITRQGWLNRIYDDLQASGMLLWIVITEVVSIVLSPAGFIGVNSPDITSIKKYSLLLLLFSICALAISFGFRGSRILSEIAPFISLFLIQSWLKARIADNHKESIT